MKVGVFSGTFDPVHAGHLSAAANALELHGLGKVLFVPEAAPRLKSSVTAFEHRWAMLELALDDPRFALWRASQAQHDGHTLREISAAHPGAELFMLAGSDVVSDDNRWPDGSGIDAAGAGFIVVPRTPQSSAALRSALAAGSEPAGLPAPVRAYIRRHGLYKPLEL
jgi:nicotinate-nucleotide adenylyltransferase